LIRAAFLLSLLLPSTAYADTWIGGAIAGNYQASEQLPTEGNAKSLEVEAGVYRWRDAEAR